MSLCGASAVVAESPADRARTSRRISRASSRVTYLSRTRESSCPATSITTTAMEKSRAANGCVTSTVWIRES